MVTDAEVGVLRMHVLELEGQVAFLYQHLGLTYIPKPGPEADPRVIEQVKKGSLIEAIKIYRELTGAGLAEAKTAVEKVKAQLGM
jgi:ribosomal protein L7/L12